MSPHTSNTVGLPFSNPDSKQPSDSLPPQHEDKSSQKDITGAAIGWILQIGVTASVVVILFGLALLAIHSTGLPAQNLRSFPQTLGEVWSGLLRLQPQAVIALGL